VEPGDVEDFADDLLAYGEEHADEFGGLYVDPPGSNSVVILFTANLAAHQAAVDEIYPGVRVRRVEYTKAELDALMESLDLEAMMSDDVQPLSVGVDESENRVVLELKTNDPTLELTLELAHGGMLDVIAFPLPGAWSNVTEGDGWRLLGAGVTQGEAYTVRAATTEDQWAQLWDALTLGGSRPDADLDEEVVVSFAHGIGSGCQEVRLDGVAIEGGVVYSETSDPLAPRACTLDLWGGAVFVVALDRDALPADGFTLRLSRDRVTGEGGGFTEELDVHLP